MINPKLILVILAILLAVCGIIWDARIGLAGLILLAASQLIH